MSDAEASVVAVEPATKAGRRLLAELAESPLAGAQYAHHVVELRIATIEAEAASALGDRRLDRIPDIEFVDDLLGVADRIWAEGRTTMLVSGYEMERLGKLARKGLVSGTAIWEAVVRHVSGHERVTFSHGPEGLGWLCVCGISGQIVL